MAVKLFESGETPTDLSNAGRRQLVSDRDVRAELLEAVHKPIKDMLDTQGDKMLKEISRNIWVNKANGGINTQSQNYSAFEWEKVIRTKADSITLDMGIDTSAVPYYKWVRHSGEPEGESYRQVVEYVSKTTATLDKLVDEIILNKASLL